MNFNQLAHYVECPNISTIKCNHQHTRLFCMDETMVDKLTYISNDDK